MPRKSKKAIANKQNAAAGNTSQGTGVGSRSRDVVLELPTGWSSEEKTYDGKTFMQFVSPCGKTFFSPSEVRKYLQQLDPNASSASGMSVSESDDSSSDYFPTPEKRKRRVNTGPTTSNFSDNGSHSENLSPVEIPNNVYVSQGVCVEQFVNDLNRTSKCATENCQGEFFVEYFY